MDGIVADTHIRVKQENREGRFSLRLLEREAHMKVNWHDVGCPDGPGSYPFKDGTINVTQQEIDVWIKHPSARFTVSSFRPWTGKAQYGLGKYDLPDD